MSDRELIERLRAVDHMSVEECFLDSFLFARAADLLASQAAEIERLRAESRDRFNAGYLIAVANIENLHCEDVIAEDVLRELGVKEAILKRLNLCEYDAAPLRRLFRNIRNREKNARQALKGTGADHG